MPSPLPSIGYFLAPFLQSIAVGGIFYGTSMLQVYYYIINCDRDPTWTKFFVAFIFIVETICMVFSFITLNTYTIGIMEHPLLLLEIDWAICATPVLINLVQILVTSYYIGRMWTYTRYQFLTVLAASLVVTRTAGFAFTQHKICSAGTWIALQADHQAKVSALVAMISAPIADAIVALSVAMPMYRSLPKIRRMRQIMTWLLVMTINTGFILVAAGLCTLVTYLKMPDSITYGGMLVLSGKLYANSLFAMLNGRLALRSRLNSSVVHPNDLMLTSISRAQSAITSPIHVHISQEVYRTDVINIQAEPQSQVKDVDPSEDSVV